MKKLGKNGPRADPWGNTEKNLSKELNIIITFFFLSD